MYLVVVLIADSGGSEITGSKTYVTIFNIQTKNMCY